MINNQSKNYEWTRAFWHVALSLILVWLLNYVKPTIFALVVSVGLLLIELFRLKKPKINDLLVNDKVSVIKQIIRKEEINNFSAFTAFALGFLLISWLPLPLLKIVILINGLADPMARVFGVTWGKTKILNTKNSWVGSSAFFAVAFMLCLIVLPAIWQVLLVALVSTIAEALPDWDAFWVDNFRIPVFAGVVLWLVV